MPFFIMKCNSYLNKGQFKHRKFDRLIPCTNENNAILSQMNSKADKIDFKNDNGLKDKKSTNLPLFDSSSCDKIVEKLSDVNKLDSLLLS